LLPKPAPEIEELFMPDRITERESHLVINEKYCRVLAVDMLPEQVYFGWFNNISHIPGVVVSITIHPYTYEEASKRVSKQQTQLGSELLMAEKRGETRRIDALSLKYGFYRHLMTDINLHRTNIAAISAVIAVSATSLEELNAKCKTIQDRLGATKATTMYLRQIEGLKTLLPGANTINEYHDVTIANAACLSPLIGVNVSHPSGVYFGRNVTGSPCFLDLFIGQPRLFGPHMFICGTTRSGKSFSVKGIVARSIAIGRKVVVIDPEGEYKNLTQALDGTYIRFHANMDTMFNPFDIHPTYDEDLGNFVDIPGKVDDIVSLLASMMEAQSGEKMTAEERSIAGQAVRLEYKSRYIIDSDPESVYMEGNRTTEEGVIVGKSYKEMPTFSSFSERLKSMGATRLYNISRDFCKGSPLGFFDGQTKAGLDSHLVVFDISSLINDYSKMFAMYVMLMWLWESYVRVDRQQEKHVVVDESWLLMLFPYTAKFLSSLARRGAKYNTSLISASQSFREFSSEEGQVFLGQCNTKFFLRMESTDAKILGQIFGLSPQLSQKISTFQQGQGLLKMNNESAIIKFEGFQFEDHFLRSDPKAMLL
jgi:conjugal transfer ATP-binding protein TraC